jgi:two-component system response regulator HupR/HoxA
MTGAYRDDPILYVHDDPRTLVVLKYVLGDQFTVISATTPAEALDVLERKSVAIVLCEHRMRGVAEGVEICARAREVQPEAARIVTTTHEERALAVAAVSAGHITCCVVKPWHDPEFIELLRLHLAEYRSRKAEQGG